MTMTSSKSIHPIELLRRGVAFQQRGNLVQAERCYQTVLAAYPDHPEALSRMGLLALQDRQYTVAIDFLKKAVALQPDEVVYRNNLGNVFLQAHRPEEALPHLHRAVELQPKLFAALANLGRSYRKLGKAELGLPYLKRAVRIQPDRHEAKLILAESLLVLGRMEEAAEHYRPLLDLPQFRADALLGLAQTRKFAAGDIELQLIDKIVTELQPDSPKLEPLHNAAGKIYNDAGLYEDAFRHYQRAKILAGANFKLEDYQKKIDRFIETFDPMFFLERLGFGSPSETPVLVVGMPRSGTTLIEQIISSHPDVYGAGELVHLKSLADGLSPPSANPQPFETAVKHLKKADCLRVAEEYLKVLHHHSKDALRIVDKMPHNFELLGLVALLFPNARIIHARRNPMDNCVSCFMNWFHGSHGYNTDLTKLGAYYREYARLMAYWRKTLRLRMLEVDYQEMVNDQEGQSRRLIEFLGLEWDPRVLTFYETERSVQTISRWQVRQPIYKTSVNRWRAYEKYLGPLKEALGDLA
jgi:tetratricopeptide (TPR) repeat protein